MILKTKSVAVAIALTFSAGSNIALAATVSAAGTEATNGTGLLKPFYQPLPLGAGPQTNDVEASDAMQDSADANGPSFNQPLYQPLPDGAGPQTNDVSSRRVLKQDIPSFTKVRAEESKVTKEELADLWDAALVNSQDVRFVVERMAPKKESIKSGGMIKELSTAMYGCFVAGEGLTKGLGAGGSQSAGAKMIMGVMSPHVSKDDKKAAVSENDAIILYKMIRDLAGKLTTNYYNYRKFMNAIDRAYVDLGDITAMVNESKVKVDHSHYVELQYLLRKAQREIETLELKMGNCRKELVTLCGAPAVEKVDVLLAEESTNDMAPHIVTGPEHQSNASSEDAAEDANSVANPAVEAPMETATDDAEQGGADKAVAATSDHSM